MIRLAPTPIVILLLTVFSLPCAAAELVPARIRIGAREAIIAPSAVFDGHRVLAPVKVLDSLGASYVLAPNSRSVGIIGAANQSGHIDTQEVDGTPMLPMDKVCDLLGVQSAWDRESSSLNLSARLLSVEFEDDTLKLNCSLPVGCSTHLWGDKLVFDLPGTRLGTEAREVYIGAALVQRARLGEPTPTDSRVVLDLTRAAGWKFESEPVSAQIRVRVATNLPRPASSGPKTASVSQAKAQPYTLSGVRLERIDDNRFDLVINTSRRATVSSAFGVKPPEISLTFKGGTLAGSFDLPDLAHPLLKSYRMSQSGTPRLTLDLKRIVAYDVSVADAGIRLAVRLPANAGGSLSSKVIAIDPGHGGTQKGACSGTVYEKDLNLRISQELASALQAQGAKVVFTRSGDSTLGLAARPEKALRSGADFFISVHCNSNGTTNSATGLETYYHLNESSPRALAFAVHAAMCNATGMADRRARSDGSLYSTGLAVLRRLEGTSLPGILLECGFINHSGDRAKLVDSAFRKKMAAGIVAGLKAYVEGTPVH